MKYRTTSMLNYFGSKFRAVGVLKQYIPLDTKELYSPFFGSGSFEIWLANNRNVRIVACDNNLLIVNFFNCIKEDKNQLINAVKSILGTWDKEQYTIAHNTKCRDDDKYLMAAKYYLLLISAAKSITIHGPAFSPNRLNKPDRKATFKGTTFYSWCDTLHKTKFDNISIELNDYSNLISTAMQKGALLYLDPPYDLKENYYGWQDTKDDLFNHKALYEQIKDYGKFVLSYNNTQYIRNLYKDYLQHFPKWTQGARKNQQSNEILILGHDIVKHLNEHSILSYGEDK